jgi:formyl-CoA transferase
VKLSRTPAEIKTATPELGAHTDEILKEAGFDEQQIKDLRAKGAI